MKLIIVESPNKTKKIQSFLDAGYKVAASAGHIRDLPEKEMGVESPDYRPQYVITKPDVVKRLKGLASSASQVILAMDPDREGEAIAWHLQTALGVKSPQRVTFNEITEKAIKNALKTPGAIDKHLVAAQESRRVLDRLVGYKVSHPLSQVLGQKASAGRVQSIAMRLVVERELEISAFRPTTHFGVLAEMDTAGKGWQAAWKATLPDGQEYMTDRALAEQIAAEVKTLEVVDVQRQEKRRKAPAPFTTSTLQQAASVALKMRPKETMDAAQHLFEAGLITYHRTDSPNLSDEAIQEIWQWLREQGMNKLIPQAPNRWKSKAGSQEAHEAIRPTQITSEPPQISDSNAAKLYTLIWQRAVASQMADACFDATTVKLASVEPVAGERQNFQARGQVVTFEGWMKLTAKDQADEAEDDDNQQLPMVDKGQILSPLSLRMQEKTTKPPARYSEASLIKKLEAEGIGRPSTYASIMTTIHARKFVTEEKGKLLATKLGIAAHEALAGRFDFYEIPFTRSVEEALDQVAEGKASYRQIVSRLDEQLDRDLSKFSKLPKAAAPVMTAESLGACPECGKPVVETPKGYGCSSFRESGCKFVIWKDALKRFGKRSIGKTTVTELLNGKSAKVKKLKSKEGKEFDCKVALEKHQKFGWQIGLNFGK